VKQFIIYIIVSYLAFQLQCFVSSVTLYISQNYKVFMTFWRIVSKRF